MKVYHTEVVKAVLAEIQNGPVSFEDLAQRLFADPKRANVIRDVAATMLPDKTDVMVGRGGGLCLKGAVRNTQATIANNELTDEVVDQIKSVMKQFSKGVSKQGVAVSFFASKLADDPSQHKQYSHLIMKALADNRIPGFHLEGRTVMLGAVEVSKAA